MGGVEGRDRRECNAARSAPARKSRETRSGLSGTEASSNKKGRDLLIVPFLL